jgi:hypothetical protein
MIHALRTQALAGGAWRMRVFRSRLPPGVILAFYFDAFS